MSKIMANKQTTAVEWFADKLIEILGDKCNELSVDQTLRNHYAFKQALAMEREQIINAHGTKITRSTKQGTEFYETKSAETYYIETYGKESNHSEQAIEMQRPRWVQFSERKPTESKQYYIKGKGGYGGYYFYDTEEGTFDFRQSIPSNKVDYEYLQWLEE